MKRRKNVFTTTAAVLPASLFFCLRSTEHCLVVVIRDPRTESNHHHNKNKTAVSAAAAVISCYSKRSLVESELERELKHTEKTSQWERKLNHDGDDGTEEKTVAALAGAVCGQHQRFSCVPLYSSSSSSPSFCLYIHCLKTTFTTLTLPFP